MADAYTNTYLDSYGDTQGATIDYAPAHTSRPLTLVSGGFVLTVTRKASAGNITLTSGTQHLSPTRKHTAGNLSLTSGNHALTKTPPPPHVRAVAHTANVLSLASGTALLQLTRRHAAAVLSLHGGDQIVATFTSPPVGESAPTVIIPVGRVFTNRPSYPIVVTLGSKIK